MSDNSVDILDIKNIEVMYDNVILALHDVSLKVPKGKVVALLGANGAGKSTTLKAVSTMLASERGKVTKGQIRYKNDKAGIIHAIIGKLDFDTNRLADNAAALISDLIKAKPSSAKGKYMKNITISSTMGPGIRVDLSSVEKRS